MGRINKILVISGKGGTGKTTIAASLVSVLKKHHKSAITVGDCDVDAPDLQILLKPEIREKKTFYGMMMPVLDSLRCKRCNLCGIKCRFGAIHEGNIDDAKCERCGLCVEICPEKALYFEKKKAGDIYICNTKYGGFIYAVLTPGEENSGKLVTQVKQIASNVAEQNNSEYIIYDGPPGIGCPVIASLSEIDYIIIVTEPTVSGIHDLGRVIRLKDNFKSESGIIINKCNINLDLSNKIEKLAGEHNIEIISKIPYDLSFQKYLENGEIISERDKEVEAIFIDIFDKIQKRL